MNRYNNWLQVFDLHQERQQSGASLNLAGSDFAEFLDVRAGDKSTPASNQDRRFNTVIGADLTNSSRDSFRYRGTQGIHRRIIDGDDGDLLIPGELN
jgi:hypothetical protein